MFSLVINQAKLKIKHKNTTTKLEHSYSLLGTCNLLPYAHTSSVILSLSPRLIISLFVVVVAVCLLLSDLRRLKKDLPTLFKFEVSEAWDQEEKNILEWYNCTVS